MMRRVRCRGVLALRAGAIALVAVVLTLHATTAAAQSPAAPAQRALELGTRAMREQRIGDAVVAFEEAYRLNPTPAVLLSLAQAYRSLGRTSAAIDAFGRYL